MCIRCGAENKTGCFSSLARRLFSTPFMIMQMDNSLLGGRRIQFCRMKP